MRIIKEPLNFLKKVLHWEIAKQLLNNQYKIDLFCGLFMNEDMGGVSLSPQPLKILADRGILLDLDIYSFMEENI